MHALSHLRYLIFNSFFNMNNLRNKVQLIGFVGQDPEIKTLENGRIMAIISMATNEFYFDENNIKIEQTEWHRVIAWGKTAEIIQKYVLKGKEIAVEGKLIHRRYEDKSGEKKSITEVVIHEILLFNKV